MADKTEDGAFWADDKDDILNKIISPKYIMGHRFADQYSLLHFASGVIMYFWYVPFVVALLGHMFFEYVENTKAGMRFINTYFRKQWIFKWPGGKDKADKPINSYLGDNFFFSLGWLISSGLDILGDNHKWYDKHKL